MWFGSTKRDEVPASVRAAAQRAMANDAAIAVRRFYVSSPARRRVPVVVVEVFGDSLDAAGLAQVGFRTSENGVWSWRSEPPK